MAAYTPRLLFCSYHSYLDPSSGAALAVRDLFELLTRRGWACGVLCGPDFDFESDVPVETLLRRHGLEFRAQSGRAGDTSFTAYHFVRNGVPITLFAPESHCRTGPPAPVEGTAFLELFERVRGLFRPDILLTYGGHWLAREVIAHAKRHGVRVVFWLRNFAYRDASLFRDVNAVLVPSETSREHYRRALGVESVAIPGPWDWERVRCADRSGQFVTFVNPQPAKGVFVFARIAAELARRRPDIPLLVVEGRAGVDWLGRTGVDWAGVTTVHRMANTPDPRDFYRLSKLVLMPSLWRESLGRVAAEALINGIPVLASRAALPETLAGAGLLLDIPLRYTPRSRVTPTAAEVAPWLEAIERLWDDARFYERQCRCCEEAAIAWRPEVLLPCFEAFFREVAQLR